MTQDFESWLSTEFAEAAQRAPLSTPQAAAARYQRAGFMNWTRLALQRRAVRYSTNLAIFAAALLFGLSAAATRSLSPSALVHQVTSAFSGCVLSLGHGDLGGCVSSFIEDHNQNKNDKPQDHYTAPVIQITPLITAGPTPTVPAVVTTSTPTPAAHATATPTPHLVATPTPTAVSNAINVNDNFQSDAIGSVPAGWQSYGGDWSVQPNSSANAAYGYGTGTTLLLLNNSVATNLSVKAAVQLAASNSYAFIVFRYVNSANYDACVVTNGSAALIRVSGGTQSMLSSHSITMGTPWTVVQVGATGTSVGCKIGTSNQTVLSGTDPTPAAGAFGVMTAGASGAYFTEFYGTLYP